MKELEVNLQLALEHGLNEQEYNNICEVLGRIPTYTELGIFSVMWSEHCSYKNSIAELKKLPRSGRALLANAGEENAGLVDIGDGLALAFKIESHNHPSAVEPYQGAATGVGGIMRDIFTMGARPIAALNSLRFGNINEARTKYLVKGVVRGIGDYGNSFGVPTVAGEVYFDECYNENPLVNAMAIGIVKHDQIARSVAKGRGNSVMIVGSSTGRDGIHGATFASEEISEKSQSKRPSVQVGDPFTEKLLLEATLEAIRGGFVLGIQDMGAAGISCSASEMSAKGQSGITIDVDRVPMREEEMSPYEIMLSESQERMLIIVSPEHEKELIGIFRKWDIECSKIGEVTDDKRLKIKSKGSIVSDIPSVSLVLGGGAPVYIRDRKVPNYISATRAFDLSTLPEPSDYNSCLLELIRSPNICSRNWITTQYDTMVRTNTVSLNADAAIIRLKETQKSIAVTTDCNARYVYLNPRRGAQIAVAESARNVVVSGATPLAITNCLNFGNPYDPEIFWQFSEAVMGIGDACKAFDTPVTGGNVSFYNEGPQGAIQPTPVIGMVGLIESPLEYMTPNFKNVDDRIILLGDTVGHLGGSEYLRIAHKVTAGDAPEIDLAKEKRLHQCCLELIRSGMVQSAHDLSEGGLAVALVESCVINHERAGALGARITLDVPTRADRTLFGEDQSRILLSTSPGKAQQVLETCRKMNVPATEIGVVQNRHLSINRLISLPTEQLAKLYYRSLGERITEE